MNFSQEQKDKATHTDLCLWLDYYGDLLSERQRQVMTLFYADDLSLAEIADLTGLTRQGVHEQVRRGASRLEEFERKLRQAERESELSRKLLQMRSLLLRCETEEALCALDDLLEQFGLGERERS
ncbi:MAG TPA: hypothetical protein GX728_03725 [Clostridiaceae bacterium]|jgi:predicted DNA-binding protein YlxM (UPF0122 family)|nr:hypothetical protein [Clostridiaceae bacterium]